MGLFPNYARARALPPAAAARPRGFVLCRRRGRWRRLGGGVGLWRRRWHSGRRCAREGRRRLDLRLLSLSIRRRLDTGFMSRGLRWFGGGVLSGDRVAGRRRRFGIVCFGCGEFFFERARR